MIGCGGGQVGGLDGEETMWRWWTLDWSKAAVDPGSVCGGG